MREGNCQNQKLRIEFHSSYWIVALGFVLTGYYLNLIVFTALILVHEFGHYLVARIFGIRVLKIIIYPYGGKCLLDDFLNRDLHEELLVAMSGVCMQFLFYLAICFLAKVGMIRQYALNLFTLYNQQMIFFNLLPIYPLDGGRIVHLLLCFFIPYYFSNLMIFFISFFILIVILGMDLYVCNYSNCMVLFLMVHYLVKFYRERKFLYRRFLLERYLYDFSFSKIKCISKLKGMYRNRSHVFYEKDRVLGEKEVLMQIF